MIILSPLIVLGAVDSTDDTNANNPIIGYHNIVTRSNITADEELANYPATNLANKLTSLGASWQGETASLQYVTVLTGYVGLLDYVGVARHNFGTAAIAVRVQARKDAGDPWTDLTDPVIPADDRPLIFQLSPDSWYQVRLELAAGAEPPRAAVMFLGKLLVLQRRIYVGHTPLPYGRVVDVQTNVSDRGNYLGTFVLGEYRQTSVQLQNLTAAWYRSYMEPFIQAALGNTFFFNWRPYDYPYESGYCWLADAAAPVPQNQRSNGMMQVTLELRGIV